MIPQLEKTLLLLRDSALVGEANDKDGISEVVKNLQQVFVSVSDTKALVRAIMERVPKLACARSESAAIVGEIQQCLDDPYYGTDHDLLETQPLDMESEKIQRKLSSQAMLLVDLLTLLKDRGDLLDDLVDGDIREMTEVLINVHESTGVLHKDARQLRKNTLDLDTKRALQQGNRRNQSSLAIQVRKSGDRRFQVWNDMDGTIFQSIQAPERSRISLRRVQSKPVSSHTKSKPLLSVANAQPQSSLALLPKSASQSTSRSPFSPPQSVTTRSAWDDIEPSTVDQDQAKRMTFTSPSQLKKTSFKEEATDVLKSYGKTPEQIRGSAIRFPAEDSSTPVARASTTNDRSSTTGSQSVPTRSDRRKSIIPSPMSSKRPSKDSDDDKDSGLGLKPAPGLGKSLDSMGGLGLSLIGTEKSSDKDEGFSSPFSGSKPSSGADVSNPLFGKKKAPTASQGSSGNGFGFGTSTPSMKNDKEESTTGEPDYNSLLTEFYQTHNPSKIGTVAATLQKYKGREPDMFRKLAQKYRVANPLDAKQSEDDKGSTESKGAPPTTTTPFQSALSQAPPSKPPLSSASPFSAATGNSTPAPAFGSQSPFSSSKPAFGSQQNQSGGLSGFANSAPSPFLQSPAPASTGTSQFAGKSPREILTAFYQQKNPNKVSEVDKLLQKYAGKEEQLFRNLAKKYQLDPAFFGISSAPTAGFGSPPPATSGFGSTSAAGAFGGAAPSPSPFGSTQPSAGKSLKYLRMGGSLP